MSCARLYNAGSHLTTSRRDHRFFVTRDSAIDGTLSASIELWTARPIRHRIATEGGYVWVPSGVSDWFAARSFSPAACERVFGVVPASDAVCMLLAKVKP